MKVGVVVFTCYCSESEQMTHWVGNNPKSRTCHPFLCFQPLLDIPILCFPHISCMNVFIFLPRAVTQISAAAAAKSLQSCLTLCDPIDGSPPGFPVPGILQARTLEWVAISFSNA